MAIKDLQTSNVSIPVAEARAAAISVTVDIEHIHRGSRGLPSAAPGLGVPVIRLHDREGGPMNNLRRTYDATTTATLGTLHGKALNGTWNLRVRDPMSVSCLLRLPNVG